ncbi:MAG: hypothetical protein WCF67_22795 [Chitinophagaceae bacterium]
MKKTLLSFLCIGSTCMVMAQTTPSSSPSQNKTNTTTNSLNQQNLNQQNTNSNLNTTPVNATNTMPPDSMNSMRTDDPMNTGRLRTTTNNAAYSVSVPSTIQTTFTTAYPAAGTNVVWSQSGDWYRARYRENGQLMEASYREDGKTLTRTASPILRTYVPEEIVNKAIDMYGVNVYAISGGKGTEGQDVYHVTVIEGGQSRTEWMNADGSAVTSPYRTEPDASMQSTDNNMNATEQPAQQPVMAQPDSSNITPDNSDMIHETPEEYISDQPMIDQGEGSEEVIPDNQMNKEGINNGTSSQDTLRRLSDEQSPEEQSSDPME